MPPDDVESGHLEEELLLWEKSVKRTCDWLIMVDTRDKVLGLAKP